MNLSHSLLLKTSNISLNLVFVHYFVHHSYILFSHLEELFVTILKAIYKHGDGYHGSLYFFLVDLRPSFIFVTDII